MVGNSIIAIGGVGGSGTRVVAEILKACGFDIGGVKNHALDNLWFNFLLLQPDWLKHFPEDSELDEAIGVFVRGMIRTTATNISESDRSYIQKVAKSWVDNVPLRFWSDNAAEFLECRSSAVKSQGWGWKEPNTHIFLPQLIRQIPNLKYIHVVRNGLDMAFSKNVNQLNVWKEFFDLEFNVTEPLPAQLLDYWIAANKRAVKIGKSQLKQNFYCLNYDMLVTEPGQELSRLTHFIGGKLSDPSVDSIISQINPTTIGRHSTENPAIFSASQLQAIKEFGYEPDFSNG